MRYILCRPGLPPYRLEPEVVSFTFDHGVLVLCNWAGSQLAAFAPGEWESIAAVPPRSDGAQ